MRFGDHGGQRGLSGIEERGANVIVRWRAESAGRNVARKRTDYRGGGIIASPVVFFGGERPWARSDTSGSDSRTRSTRRHARSQDAPRQGETNGPAFGSGLICSQDHLEGGRPVREIACRRVPRDQAVKECPWHALVDRPEVVRRRRGLSRRAPSNPRDKGRRYAAPGSGAAEEAQSVNPCTMVPRSP